MSGRRLAGGEWWQEVRRAVMKVGNGGCTGLGREVGVNGV